eukprot:scaffold3597_cov395-Prasinococcus_capsulatus_cf.AAC.2
MGLRGPARRGIRRGRPICPGAPGRLGTPPGPGPGPFSQAVAGLSTPPPRPRADPPPLAAARAIATRPGMARPRLALVGRWARIMCPRGQINCSPRAPRRSLCPSRVSSRCCSPASQSPAAPSSDVDGLLGVRNIGAHRAVPTAQVQVGWHTGDPDCSPRKRACGL